MTCWKKLSHGDSERSVVAGVRGRKGCRGGAQRFFRTVKIRRMIRQWWKRVVVHLFKRTEHRTSRVNCNVKYGLWMIMTCLWRFISGNKRPTLVEDAASGAGCAYMGAGGGGPCKISVFYPQFCCEPKAALKNSPSKEKYISEQNQLLLDLQHWLKWASSCYVERCKCKLIIHPLIFSIIQQ